MRHRLYENGISLHFSFMPVRWKICNGRWQYYRKAHSVLNVAMKSSSCTGTRLNWHRNSKKQDDSVEGLMLCYVYRTSQLLLMLSAQCILVRWERGSLQRRALWSVENEALQRSKALWSAESEATSHGKISNFPTFLLYLDYELLLRSLHSNNLNIFHRAIVEL